MQYTEDFYLTRSRQDGTGYKSRPTKGSPEGWYVCIGGLRERWNVGKKLPARLRFGVSFECDRDALLVQYLPTGMPNDCRWQYMYSYEHDGRGYWGLAPVPPYMREVIERLCSAAGRALRQGMHVWIICEVG